jgi:hypothetical protein
MAAPSRSIIGRFQRLLAAARSRGLRQTFPSGSGHNQMVVQSGHPFSLLFHLASKYPAPSMQKIQLF